MSISLPGCWFTASPLPKLCLSFSCLCLVHPWPWPALADLDSPAFPRETCLAGCTVASPALHHPARLFSHREIVSLVEKALLPPFALLPFWRLFSTPWVWNTLFLITVISSVYYMKISILFHLLFSVSLMKKSAFFLFTIMSSSQYFKFN